MARAEITTNADNVAAQLLAHGLSAGMRTEAIEDSFAQTAAAMMSAAAPRGNGDYAASIQARDNEVGTDAEYEQGPPTSTSRWLWARLEFGFVGTDGKGRTVSQAPQPHVRPVVEALTEPFERAVGEAVVKD